LASSTKGNSQGLGFEAGRRQGILFADQVRLMSQLQQVLQEGSGINSLTKESLEESPESVLFNPKRNSKTDVDNCT